ncbi:MAG: Crp/Fnr family transcriptional regulator [Saprospiraceae bacterium]
MGTESIDIQQALQQYFPNLVEPALQAEVVEHGQIRHFSAGEIIMDYDSYIRSVPLVISGSVKVIREGEDGNELFLYYLQASEACSMSFSCCMMHKKSVIKAIAEEDTTLIAVPTQKVENWLSKYTSWKNFVMRSYDERMFQLVKVIDSIAFSNMDERLLQYLEKRALAIKSYTIQVTHQEIAYDLNASREAVSRLLKRLEKIGKVQLGRNVIYLKNES